MANMFVIALILLIFLTISYWGIPFFSFRKKLYQPPDIDNLPEVFRPLEKKGSEKTGILLLHGFEGSPFEMKELGEHLNNIGYTISIPLLPGHGTSIDDLVQTDFNDWYEYVEDHYLKLSQKCQRVYLIGLSIGGLLSLKLAEKFEPAAIITLSAPVFFNRYYNGKWVITDFRLFFSGLLALFIKKIPIKRKENKDICPWEGYEDYLAVNCLHSIKLHMHAIRKNLYRINSPICLLHAQNDSTVIIENFYYILYSVNSKEKRAFSFRIPNELSTNHILTTNTFVKDRVFSYIFQFIQDCEHNFQLNPRRLIGIKGLIKHYFNRFGKRYLSKSLFRKR
jgi:carboxylesterase